jgi:hypothetical protein
MSRSRTIAVGLTAGAVLAMSLVGCAKAVSGTPQAASTPTTRPSQSSGSGGSGSGGSGSSEAAKFCATITPAMVQRAFGVPGAKVTVGAEQSNNGVTAVSCTVSATGGSSVVGIDVIAFDYSGVSGATVQSVLQNAQQQLTQAGTGTNFQSQTGVGDADGAFSCNVTDQSGQSGFAVFAAKQLQGAVSAAAITAIGQVQMSQVLAFAKLVDSN